MSVRSLTALYPIVRRSSSQLWTLLLGLLSVVCAQPSWALYTVIYDGTLTQLVSGLTNPNGLALDLQGNLYVADTGNNHILKVLPDGTVSTLDNAGVFTGVSAMSSPQQLAVDSAGNLYIADSGNNRIIKVSPSGNGSLVSLGGFTLNNPQGVAVDNLGNVFIADTGNNRIIEVTSSGSTLLSTALNSPISSASFSDPVALAIDTYNNLYIVDKGNNRVVQVTAAPGLEGNTVSTYQSLDAPVGVTVANNGVIYIVDGSDQVRVAIHDPQGDLYDLFDDDNTAYFGTPTAIAIDSKGAFYLTNVSNGTAGSGVVNLFHQGSADFGHVQLGSSGAVQTLKFQINGLSNVTAVGIYTQGTQNLDYTIAANSGTPCVVGSNDVACTVNVQFTPQVAGLRRGALVLSYTNDFLGEGNFTVPLFGVGDGPVAALSPGVASQVSPGSLTFVTPFQPFQTATDGAGNIYATDYANSQVLKFPAGGGSATVVNIPTLQGVGTISNPTGIAIDGAGNLFVADSGNNRIVEITPAGASEVINIIGAFSGFSNPQSLFIDGSGDLVVDDAGNNRIVDLTVAYSATDDNTLDIVGAYVLSTGNYSISTGTATASPYNYSTSAAFDAYDDLYVADDVNNRVIKINRFGQSSLVDFSSLSTGLTTPHSLTFDPMGNLYVMDAGGAAGAQRIIQQFTTGTNSTLAFSGGALGSSPNEIAVDSSGNVLAANYSTTSGQLLQINVGQSSQTFATPVMQGATSASALTTTVTNLGDLDLLFSANPAYTADFSENTGDGNLCNLATSLTVGLSCDVSINFTPQSVGSLSANIAVTDNAQNGGPPQQIAVSGTALVAGDATAAALTLSPMASSYSYGEFVAISAHITDTISGHTSDIPTGSVTFSDTFNTVTTPLNNGGSVTLDGTGRATLSNVLLSGIGVHTITVNYSGVSGSYLASSNTITITQNQASVTVAGPSTQPVSVIVGQAGSIALTVTPAYTGGVMPSGSVGYSILNASNASVASGTASLTAGTSNSTATIPIPNTLAAGSYTIQISYAGDGNYQPASTITISLVIGENTPTISWAPPSSIVYSDNLSSILTATASFANAAVPGTFTYTATPSGGAAAAVTSATVLGAGTYTLTATFTPTNSSTYMTVTKSIHLTVSQATPTISWTAPSSITYGASLSGVLTATASFEDNSVPGTFTYTASPTGGAPVSVTAATVLGAGSYTLTATFTPTNSSAYMTVTKSVSLTVSAGAASVALSSSSNPSIVTNAITFTATVTAATGSPTGTISFLDGTTLLAAATLANGQASYTTSSLAVGAHNITAMYSGDNNYSSTTSAALSELVQDFTISTPTSGTTNAPTATVTPGGAATYTLSIGPSVGTVFPAPVTLSLEGLPPGATGTLSPTTLPAGSSLSNVTLIIQLPQTAQADRKQNPLRNVPPIALGLLILPFARNWRRTGKRMRRTLTMLVLLIGAAGVFIGLTGCGSGNGFFATAPKQYSISIVATCENVSHSTNVTLTVE